MSKNTVCLPSNAEVKYERMEWEKKNIFLSIRLLAVRVVQQIGRVCGVSLSRITKNTDSVDAATADGIFDGKRHVNKEKSVAKRIK